MISLGCLVFWPGESLLRAQSTNGAVSLPELMQGAQDWVRENLDTNVLAALPPADPEAVQQFYRDLQGRIHGDLVVDLAALRQTAQTMLPLLESQEATQPYAAWLKAQMDYLDVADDIRITAARPLPGNNATNRAAAIVANPPPQAERELWIRKVTGRPWPPAARAAVTKLKPVFAGKNIPTELVWIAEVESAFDGSAQSPAGAGGMFQLMPDTAKRFGLSLWPRDQRFQTIPSANASADYIKYLYGRFHDWRLVMAAYNAGEGTVQKLLTRHKTRNYDDIAVHLPAETQMYVPRVEAVVREREGVTLEELPPPQD